MDVRRPRGGKITVSTSLAQVDVERLAYLASRDHVSQATWMRRVVAAALATALPGVTIDAMRCTDCAHLPSEHTSRGCSACRCPRYRPPREDA